GGVGLHPSDKAVGPWPAPYSSVRVLVVSGRATRLFEAVRDELSEIEDHGFALGADIVPRDRPAVAGRFARSPRRDDQELWRNFYREVDEALAEASRDDELPIVLA